MCLGNRAEASAAYINSQFTALWANARHCTEKHGTGVRPLNSVVEYGTCLYEYYGPGKPSRYNPCREDFSFYAKFNAPRLEFVCNHEVILFLEVAEGHVRVPAERINNRLEPEILHKLQPSTIAIRLNFSVETIDRLVCKAIGNGMDAYTLNLMVLLPDTFDMTYDLSKLPSVDACTGEQSYMYKQRITHALTHQLRGYLNLIKCAGHHVLYSLPDFDNLTSTSAHIDYSVISKTTLSVQEIYGIEVTKINEYLRGLWLQNAMHVHEEQVGETNMERTMKTLLSGHSTVWEGHEDINIHMVFGPMQVQPLCKREVLLYLDIPKIEFHIGGWHEVATHKFERSRLALIVNIIFEKIEGEYVKQIRLDLSSARVCEHFSSLNWGIKDTNLLVRLQRTFVTYIIRRYITFIRQARYEVVYHHDTRIVVKGSGEESFSESEEEEESSSTEELYGCTCETRDVCHHGDSHKAYGGVHIRWKEIERIKYKVTQMAHFDFVTAITQRSVNSYFGALWELARSRVKMIGQGGNTWTHSIVQLATCMSEYGVTSKEHGEEVFFWANFGPMRIQFPVEVGAQHVVLYLTLQEGFLKVLGDKKKLLPGGQEHQIQNWRIAFRVPLKLVDCSENNQVSAGVLGATGRTNHSSFKQLVLDFDCARIMPDCSFIPGLLDSPDTHLILQKYQALVHYISAYYFATLKRAGMHVMHTISMFDAAYHGQAEHAARAVFAMKHVGFQLVPFAVGPARQTWECAYGKTRYLADRNMIVFFGMRENPLPHITLEPGIPWVCGVGKEIPDGTVVLSRKAFLEGRLLRSLEKINRCTTIVPGFDGVNDGQWMILLTTWDKHQYKKNRPALFKPVKGEEDRLSFAHFNREEWQYHYEGGYFEEDDSVGGQYKVKCNTINKLSIPSENKHGSCSIFLDGRVELALAHSGAREQWSAHVAVTWRAAISLVSDANTGIKVTVSPAKIVPQFEQTAHHGDQGASVFKSVYEQLTQQLPSVIDLSYVTQELQAQFENAWEGICIGDRGTVVTNPVFNAHGDLMLSLRLKEAIYEGQVIKSEVDMGESTQVWSSATGMPGHSVTDFNVASGSNSMQQSTEFGSMSASSSSFGYGSFSQVGNGVGVSDGRLNGSARKVSGGSLSVHANGSAANGSARHGSYASVAATGLSPLSPPPNYTSPVMSRTPTMIRNESQASEVSVSGESVTSSVSETSFMSEKTEIAQQTSGMQSADFKQTGFMEEQDGVAFNAGGFSGGFSSSEIKGQLSSGMEMSTSESVTKMMSSSTNLASEEVQGFVNVEVDSSENLASEVTQSESVSEVDAAA